jgi:hypothetical protein
MTEHQVETAEQSPASLPLPASVPQKSADPADIDWEIEIIAQRRGDANKGTKTDGSQGCH